MTISRRLGASALVFLSPLLSSLSLGVPGHEFDEFPFSIEYIRMWDIQNGDDATIDLLVNFKESGDFLVECEYLQNGAWHEKPLTLNGGSHYFSAGNQCAYQIALSYDEYRENNGCFAIIIYHNGVAPTAFNVTLNLEEPSEATIVEEDGKITFSKSYVDYKLNAYDWTTTRSKTVAFTGLYPSFVDSELGLLPLDEMKVRQIQHWSERVLFRYDSIKLYLLNNLEDFAIGELGYYHNQKARVFELAVTPMDSEGISGFQTKESSYVSQDFRYQREEKVAGDYQIKGILIPPVTGSGSRTYDFVMVFEGVGIGQCMTITYPFTYVRTKNIVGYCPNSDYCVVEAPV